jgi:UDP-N-acetylglucosamine 2-epimerase (non-hydrolysing)
MIRIERVLLEHKSGIVLVYGDVNSTVAAALVAVKVRSPLPHVEAGLRSFDRSMPEKINRIVTDRIADMLFTPSEDGDENLLREGISPDRIFRVGNVMIATLVRLEESAKERWPLLPHTLGVPGYVLEEQPYAVVTLHRPSNVDEPTRLTRLVEALANISQHLAVVFPVHPCTHERLHAAGIDKSGHQLWLVAPVGYLDLLALQKTRGSGNHRLRGIQETTFLGVPCLTVRTNTERLITTSLGTNRLIGSDVEGLKLHVKGILNGDRQAGRRPPLWDGHAGERIAGILATHLTSQHMSTARSDRAVAREPASGA